MTTQPHFCDLYDLAPVAYITLSAGGLILQANRQAALLLGVPGGALAKRGFKAFIQPPDRNVFYLYRHQFLKTREPFSCDLRLVSQDGKPFWAYLTVNAIPAGDAAEPAPLLRMVLIDITERKRLEREQVAFDSELQLAQKRETIAVLAGGVAHDFNNLLTAIVGNATMGELAVADGEDATPHFQAIEKAAMKAADLTRQLLAYAGKGKYQVAEVGLNIAAVDLIQILSGTLPAQVTLHCDLAERLPGVMADATQVFQILMNLVTNASEAFALGTGGRITLRTRSEYLERDLPGAADWALLPKPGPYASLEVVDTGCGMTPEVTAKAFEPFFSTKFTGRGLGLAAVLGILRSHGGGLKVVSEPGHGASFKLFLPVKPDPDSAAEARPVWRGDGSMLLAQGGPERNTARRLAEQLGFSVLEARDGPEALELFRLHHRTLGLALIDLDLPGMAGWEALRAMRAIDGSVPLALSSGSGGTEVDLAAEGLAGFLRKPFRLAEFQGLLQRSMALRCP